MSPSWLRYFRPQDFVWLLLFSTLAALDAFLRPESGVAVRVLLIGLGVAAALESRIGAVTAIVIELALCYALIYPRGLDSGFFVFPLLPVISAATNFGLRGMALSTLAACAVYLSFLLRVDWKTNYLLPEDWFELALRALLYPVVGFLTFQLAEANRMKTRTLEATAFELAEANTHLQQAQAEIRRSERLAALGQLTAGLAHELRNPLGTMKTSAELLQRQVGGDNAIAAEMAGYIAAEVDRTNSLITRFLDFARPLRLNREKHDLAALLDRVIERFNREKSGGARSVSVFRNYSPDIPPMAFDAQLLEGALLNLVINAAQASPPDGVVTIKTRRVEGNPGPGVEISVIDRGCGIDPKNLESIFNPFFTTKPDGVGLGLAIVSKIVDDHGGKIAVESTPGEGSVFRVYLPAQT
ncbi:MAG TPA: ATP-binding protein [Bryobacteraceae bacterium]|nr:ATP-binding protein [Bryobacteraceae bacterium]